MGEGIAKKKRKGQQKRKRKEMKRSPTSVSSFLESLDDCREVPGNRETGGAFQGTRELGHVVEWIRKKDRGHWDYAARAGKNIVVLSDGFWILIDQNEVPNMAVLEHQPHARNRAKKRGAGGWTKRNGPAL